jgi:hypothetical protein
MQKLCQVVAIEKPTKQRVEREVTDLYKALQKADLFEGFQRVYSPLREDGEKFPPESKVIQVKATEALAQATKALGELLDISATRDFANCQAQADVVVDGETLIKGAPTTFLLFLEKQLNDFHSMVAAMPVLDPAEVWTKDENAGVYRAPARQTSKTKKISKAIVLHPPTKEHPAQTQLIQDDEVVGHWEMVRQSGAVPAPWKKNLLVKVEKVQAAVKYAREEANTSAAPGVKASQVLDWILK